nr:MAG TPA: Protein of unknown function (DUF1414) [Bacteriophage sp.]
MTFYKAFCIMALGNVVSRYSVNVLMLTVNKL